MLAHLPNWAMEGISAPQRPKTKFSVLGLTFLLRKVVTARTLWIPIATVAGSIATDGVLVLPTRLTVLPSIENTVPAIPRPRTVTMNGLVAQAPGTMPGE